MGKDLTQAETKYLSDIASFSLFDDEDMASDMGGGFAPNRISRDGNRFTLITSEGDEQPLPNPLEMLFTIIATKKPSLRTYYDSDDRSERKPPRCMSFDGVTPDVDDPIHPTCKGCEKAGWTSATSKFSGLGIPACHEKKQAVIKVVGIDGLWLFDMRASSATSRKNPKNWEVMYEEGRKAIAKSQGKVSWPAIVVKAEFDAKKTGIIKFELAGYLRDQNLAEIATLLQDDETKKEVLQMLWGSDGAARKAQYETGRGRSPVAPMRPLMNWDEKGPRPFEETVEAPVLSKPVEVVEAEPPIKRSGKRVESAPSTDKVSAILAGMGL